MKLQTILLLTGIAAGLMTVSCQSTEDEAEAFFGRPGPNRKKAIDAEDKANANFYDEVGAHIDRKLNEFNEKEEVRLPVFASTQAKADFMEFSFIKSAEQIELLSIDFIGPDNVGINYVFDRDSRSLTRKTGDKTETYVFEPFTNGVPPEIPYDAHILYAFALDFNRIAESVTLRCYERLEQGENPAIAQLENEANIDKNGKKKNKNFVEIKPKVTTEPIEFRIDNRWCNCYDVKLKSICSPASAMVIYVNHEEKTISRLDVVLDDDSKITYLVDWREQNGIVLPRVIRRLNDNAVYFRDETSVITKRDKAEAAAKAAAEAAAEAAAKESAGEDDSTEDDSDGEMVEYDASDDTPDFEEE